MPIDIEKLEITSPKRTKRGLAGWEGFFPYYAGFPEAFAERLIRSANLGLDDCIVDPWNGSGTTTYTASRLGVPSFGLDLNPVMAVIARARALPATEHDSLVPLAKEILQKADRDERPLNANDPLKIWFGPRTSTWIRRVESAARDVLISERSQSNNSSLDSISAIAATFYVALFAMCRELAKPYQSSNPTWVRRPRKGQRRASRPASRLATDFAAIIEDMAAALSQQVQKTSERAPIRILVGDATKPFPVERKAEFILTSPPYCTRLDYTAATRLQLAVLWPVMSISTSDLSRQMTGSIRIPLTDVSARHEWGPACNAFLRQVQTHKSKASAGYYLKTHADYFSKMYNSLNSISNVLVDHGAAVLIVQDSHYKDIHNDLPLILSQMAAAHGLALQRQVDFPLRGTLAGSHPHTRSYRKSADAIESVLCFQKQ